MPCNSNNFYHIEKILGTSVDDLVLQISLKFQVDRIKILRVLLLAELKNAVLRKTRLNVESLSICSLGSLTWKTKTFKIKYFPVPDLLHFIFEYRKYILSQKVDFFKILQRRYLLIQFKKIEKIDFTYVPN